MPSSVESPAPRITPTTRLLDVELGPSPNQALLDVCLQHSEGLFMPLECQLQSVEHPLGRVVIRDNPLGNHDRFAGHTDRLRIQTEIDNQFFGGAGHAAEIRVAGNGPGILDLDPLGAGRGRSFLSGLW